MPGPDMQAHLVTLVRQELRTPVTGAANLVLGVEGSRVRVATERNRGGGLVNIELLQGVVDRVWDGEEVVFDQRNRSAFVGAVLATLPEVEVLTDPRRARLRAQAPSLRSPAWEPDELILALDLYLRWRPRQPPTGHPDLVALSGRLRRLPIHDRDARPGGFRGPGSVRRKLGDFKAADPEYIGTPPKGGTALHGVWHEYAEAPEALAAAVAVVARAAEGATEPLPVEDDEVGVIEGRLVYREHRARERSQTVVRAKKDAVLRAEGRLACEVCDVDFVERYGPVGEGFIEAHHTLQIAIGVERVTTVDDLALVCSNCHRMIHRGRPTLSLDELREAMRATSTESP